VSGRAPSVAMSLPSAIELLDAWEAGQGRPPAERALALLRAAEPDAEPAALERRSVGRRNAGLLALRTALFGSRLVGLVTCPACGERVETTFSTAALDPGAVDDGRCRVERSGWRVSVRPPDSSDLAAAARTGDPTEGRRELLARCIVEADCEDAAAGEMPPAVLAAVLERLAAADPAGDVELRVDCPRCGHAWGVDLDIAAFLWDELSAWSERLLDDVHALATAYGWSEREILSMTPWRRHAYVARATA
jgi:hypothetical protein